MNVADQRRDQDSLLNWMERIMRRRKETPEFGWGVPSLLDTGDDAVLAHRCDWEGNAVVAIHNLDAAPREVRVDLGDMAGVDEVVDLLEGRSVGEVDGSTIELKLGGYAHVWFRLEGSGRATPP